MAKVAAVISLLLGAYALLAVASLLGAPIGAFVALLGLFCSWAALHNETPPRWARRSAKTGAVLAMLALLGFAVIVVAVLVSELLMSQSGASLAGA